MVSYETVRFEMDQESFYEAGPGKVVKFQAEMEIAVGDVISVGPYGRRPLEILAL
mgnify:CR=1 FL=1